MKGLYGFLEQFTPRIRRRLVVFATAVWIIGLLLCLAAASDLFTVNPFQKRYLMVGILNLMAILMIINLHIAYRKLNKSS
ncbi:MAG: hypothetical protein WBA16_07525 [Nonlabens sp.]